jgi:predicted metal-binding membrane protein
MDEMDRIDMGIATRPDPTRPDSVRSLVFFVTPWLTMVAAMTLPGTAATVLSRAHASGRIRAVPLFVGSYLAAWSLVGVAVNTPYRLHRSIATDAVAIAADVYECTPLKQRLRRHYRESVRPGFEFELYCADSSIGLVPMPMPTLVALSAMSVTWISVITVLVVTQKLLPAKAAIDMPLALPMVGLRVLILIAPAAVPRLMPQTSDVRHDQRRRSRQPNITRQGEKHDRSQDRNT